MLNARYPYGNQKILEGDIAWNTDPIVALLVGTESYTYNPVHQHLADVPEAARVAMSGTLTGRTADLGVADASDLVFAAVPAGPTANAVILLKSTGTESNSVLIAYISDCRGLPYNPDGSNIELNWNNGASKIFVL
jgi:hypothetical protein